MNRRARAIAACVASCFITAHAAAVSVEVQVNAPSPVATPIDFSAEAVGTGEVTFTWDFGDGQKSEPTTSGTVTHTYDAPGHYPVIVVAKDSTGARSGSFLQTVHRALPPTPPASSSNIVHHAGRQRVCNVNADNDTLSCISTETLQLLFEVPVGRHPRSLAVAPDGTLWVANQDDASITVLDADGAALATIALPYACRPSGIVMNVARGVAYVSLQALGEIAEIDVASGALLRRAPAGPFATGVAVDSSGSRIFVTRLISPATGGEIVELSADTLEQSRQLQLGLDPGPDTEATARGVPNYLRAAVPSPDGYALWVPSKQDNILRGPTRDGQALTFETSVRTVVSLVELASNQELLEERTDLNNRALGLSLTFSPVGDYAFVALLGNNGVEVLDAYDRQIVAGAFDLGKAPDGLVLDDAGRLYVNSFLSRSVVILDASSVLASTGFSLDRISEVVVSTAEKLPGEVLAGKVIFYDASDLRMGLDGYISCAACHLDGFEDGQIWDFTDRGEGLRNTTSLLGKRGTGQGPLHWSANFDEVQDFEHDIRNAFGGTGFLPDEVFNEGTRNTTLGDSKAGHSPELDALSAYVTSLDRVPASPYRAQDGLLTREGWRGREVFQRAGCPACHSGPDFTDSVSGLRHDVGTLQATSGQRLGGPLDGLDTPTLRGVWQSGPYLHDGSALSLLEVVDSRNPDDRHGATRSLSDTERHELTSYLLQIDNTPLEDEVEPPDPSSKSEPGGGCAVRGSRVPEPASNVALGVLALLGFAGRRRASRRAVPK